MTNELQEFLKELAEPSVIAPDAVRTSVARFLGEGAKVAEQVAVWQRLLQAAEIFEAGPAAPMLEEGHQLLGALQRETGNAVKALRRIDTALRALAEWGARLHAASGGTED